MFPKLHRAVMYSSIFNLHWLCVRLCGSEEEDSGKKIHCARLLKCISYRTVVALLNITVMIIPLVQSNLPTSADVASQTCNDFYPTTIWMVYILVFSLDVVLQALATATENDPFYYLWPFAKTQDFQRPERRRFLWNHSHILHLVDVSFVVMLIIAVCNICSDHKNVNWTLFLAPLRVLKCGTIALRFEPCRMVAKAATECIPGMKPQLYLFLAIYYVFIMIGCGLFAGCVTQNAPAGPGDWTGAEWEGWFADASYYYDLNFDNPLAAFTTLFMLMIQNNWYVTVEGYELCTGTRWVRVYFLLFNIITAMVMLNILTGVVLDMYEFCHFDQSEQEELEDRQYYEQLVLRLQKFSHPVKDQELTDEDPKRLRRLEQDWELVPTMNSFQLYGGVSASDSVKLASQQSSSGSHLDQMLKAVPLPIYARTKGNKITYCNKVFANMYGKRPKEIVGLCENFQCGIQHLGKPVERDVTPHHLALQKRAAAYVEKGFLLDGTEVLFQCSEYPIDMPWYGQCTVVYMVPINAISGGVIVDLNGDGDLTCLDELGGSAVDDMRQSEAVRRGKTNLKNSINIASRKQKQGNRQRRMKTDNGDTPHGDYAAALVRSRSNSVGANIEKLDDIVVAIEMEGAISMHSLSSRSLYDEIEQQEPEEFFQQYAVLCSINLSLIHI
eukprot:TRINITY_DN4324_c0_g1_i2.p1 TRINITY_DN4324_c0_g1~~TRINITY_DN4324_c0_g1_i2.p1  ORF type:complete len:669 (-),score=170.63 TRINITY_DN4324_c0_g1_i2:160-2166(-)